MPPACIPVIIAGGAGTRLWPVSREALPKPFLRMSDGDSLLAATLRRALSQQGVVQVLTVLNREHHFLARREYARVGDYPALDFLLEPLARDTAPAIAAAALHVAEQHGEEAVMLVLPADHMVKDLEVFGAAVTQARALAEHGWLVAFGVPPTSPETGFGYIEAGDSLGERAARVHRFVEKPDAGTAARFLASGRFAWNSGMFCFSAGAIIEALATHAPLVREAAAAALSRSASVGGSRILDADAFGRAPQISIDRAVMEHARNAAVVQAQFGWSDVGCWDALAELERADEGGNSAAGDAVLVGASGCFVRSDSRVVAAVGVNDLVIVDTPDALLVASRGRSQEVRQAVQRLRLAASETVREHRTAHRPWGSFTVLDEGPRFKVKRLEINPGASLSLQMHCHRSEHWVVVSGSARVLNGGAETTVRPDEAVRIPTGTMHRITNTGQEACVLVEVQVGDYTGEDDIVRFADEYGRS